MNAKEKIKSILEDHAKNNNNDYQNLISMIADDIIKAFPQISDDKDKLRHIDFEDDDDSTYGVYGMEAAK